MATVKKTPNKNKSKKTTSKGKPNAKTAPKPVLKPKKEDSPIPNDYFSWAPAIDKFNLPPFSTTGVTTSVVDETIPGFVELSLLDRITYHPLFPAAIAALVLGAIGLTLYWEWS